MPVRKKYPEPPTTWTYDIYNPRWPHTPLAKRILKPFDIKRVCLTRKPKTAWENLRGMPAIIWHHTFDLRYCLFGVALATYIYYKLRPKSDEARIRTMHFAPRVEDRSFIQAYDKHQRKLKGEESMRIAHAKNEAAMAAKAAAKAQKEAASA